MAARPGAPDPSRASASHPDAPPAATLAITVTVAILAVSTAAILIRLSDAPALVIAFHRLLFSTLILAPVALVARRHDLAALTGRDWLLLSGVGVVLAVHFAAWITSLELTTVAASVVLVTMHPVFVGLASARLFGEGLPARGWVGVVVALAGSGIIAAGDASRGSHAFLGDVLAIIGGLAAAAYFLAGRGFRRRLPLLAYVVPVYATSTLVLLVMALVAGQPVTGYAPREYGLFLALAVVPMILGHTLLNYALKFVTAPVIATTILGEPVGSTLLALLILAEVPPADTLVGGVIVLAGIATVVLANRRSGGSGKQATGGSG